MKLTKKQKIIIGAAGAIAGIGMGSYLLHKTLKPDIVKPPPECITGTAKCVGEYYHICEAGKWVNKGKVPGQCGVPIDAGPTTFSIKGFVKCGELGIRLAGATISMVDVATGNVYKTTSDAYGEFVLSGLPLGTYNIETTLKGYKKKTLVGISFTVAREYDVLDYYTTMIPEVYRIDVSIGTPGYISYIDKDYYLSRVVADKTPEIIFTIKDSEGYAVKNAYLFVSTYYGMCYLGDALATASIGYITARCVDIDNPALPGYPDVWHSIYTKYTMSVPTYIDCDYKTYPYCEDTGTYYHEMTFSTVNTNHIPLECYEAHDTKYTSMVFDAGIFATDSMGNVRIYPKPLLLNKYYGITTALIRPGFEDAVLRRCASKEVFENFHKYYDFLWCSKKTVNVPVAMTTAVRGWYDGFAGTKATYPVYYNHVKPPFRKMFDRTFLYYY